MSILDRMNFRALDSNFDATDIVEGYESMIWTEKYNDVGDFDLQGANNEALRLIANGASYIFNSITNTLMVVEKPSTSYKEEDGDTLEITGRSMSSVLDRRVMLTAKTIVFKPEDTGDRRISKIICNLVSEAFGPSDPARYWPALQVVDDTTSNDESVKLTVGTSLPFNLGDNLLDIVRNLCVAYNFGFKFMFSPSTKAIYFIVYEGENHSSSGNIPIMFSDQYDNLLSSKETISIAGIKNTMLVVGSSVDPVTQIPRLPQLIGNANVTGLERRETYFDSGQLDTSTVNGVQCQLSSAEYIAALQLAGTKELATETYQIYTEYEGAIIEVPGCQYGIDFVLGDTISFLLPDQSVSLPARIDGMTFSDDAETGPTLAPTFTYLFATPEVGPTIVLTPDPVVTGNPTITLTTFGYLFSDGEPSGQKFIMDARNIDTSHYNWGPGKNGLNPTISAIVLGKSTAKKDLKKMHDSWIPNLVDGDKIAIGCSRGHHRSVALAEGPRPKGVSLKYVLQSHGFNVVIVNRDMNKTY